MKVSSRVRSASDVIRRTVTVAVTAVLMMTASAVPAHAITRPEVLKRANSWIKKRVPYSQSSYYDGYRQDCSGFVSMAWKLKSSYTSSDIGSQATRISMSALKPGDAVRRTGHVEIFDGWKSKAQHKYWALEESTWGKPALRAVKQFKSGYTALRLRGIKEAPPAKKPAPQKPPVAPAPLPSDPATSTETSPSVPGTLSPSVPSTLVLVP